YLKKLPGIGPKAAAQIILDLKGKLIESDAKGNPTQYDEVRQALKQMGFKVKEVDDALSSINEPGASNQEILRLALRALSKKKD
ncbi:MAG: Holliday junction branch migration protein RuvA, partial [Candidatus Enteromonas sp.]|nr:Holliday junction branch migration protein RuvA [Candidatus Enteromonas sp.]